MSEERQYLRRIQFAVAISVFAHAALFLAGMSWKPATPGDGPVPDFVVLDLDPDLSSAAKQLVETVTPSDTPPEQADYIARANTQAADAMLREGAQQGPINEIESREERLGASGAAPLAVPATPPLAAPQTAMPAPAEQAPAPSDTAEAAEAPMPKPAPESEPSAEPAPKRERMAAVQETMRERKPEPAPERPREMPAPAEAAHGPMAQARPAAIAPPAPASPPRGRLNNGVMTKGFTSYSAIEDEIAPYLEQVKKRVELRWREALLLQYSGSQPRDVEVDCEIARDGKLVSVKLAEPSEDRIYGQLCLDAIRKAAPFEKFPFEVPDIYRNQNLEIRWHFSFL